ncbi:MAG: hypothetical protein FVQ83_06140 [Chloroflexi bacterium]|nr:hypothetical protein [Chloroflexota bacterium]
MGYMMGMIKMWLSKASRVVRAGNWWLYKIPPLLSIAYLGLLKEEAPPEIGLLAILGVLISLISVAAYGHIINDVFDIDEDRRAGKPNIMADRNKFERGFLSLTLLLTGFTPWLWIDFGPGAAAVLAANYLLPTIYSIPPVRLKERGVWGIISDASGAHAVPTLFIFIAMITVTSASIDESFPLVVTATSWAFFVGLRGILLHQLWDRANDMRAGAETLAARLNPLEIRRFAVGVIFPIEMLAFGAVIWVISPFAPWALYTVVLYAIYDLLKYKFILKIPFDPLPISTSAYFPPHGLYVVWIPIVLTASLAAQDPRYLLVLILQVSLFFKDVKARGREATSILKKISKQQIGNLFNWQVFGQLVKKLPKGIRDKIA